MNICVISSTQQYQLTQLVNEVSSIYSSAECPQFLSEAYLWAGDIPKLIKAELLDLKNNYKHLGIAVIKGFQSNVDIPATPKTWYIEDSYAPNQPEDYLAVIFASFLGEPFGFKTQQDGKLIHDIVPIKGKEYFQAGCNSLSSLTFHVEDAFHQYRGEFLGITCYKNPTNRGTSYASINNVDIPNDIKTVLLQKRFYTLPDNTHDTSLDGNDLHSILFGNPDSPFIRIDPDFSYAKEGDVEAERAINFLVRLLRDSMCEVPLERGDFCFIDNYKCVHGRRPFVAKFDGNDRWLKRLNITSDLKKSSGHKRHISSRYIDSSPIFSVRDSFEKVK
jgi:hypothetical protein